MKTKHFAVIILSSLLLVTVFAGLGGAKTLMDVFVTNTSDNPVPVDITDDSLDVEVTNSLDVSGWLHTTESGRAYEESVTTAYYNMITIDTKGFKQLTINYYTYGDDCEFLLYMNVWTSPTSFAGIDVILETVSSGNPTTITYDVISDFVDVLVTPKTGGPTIVAVTYYMTT